MSTTVSPTVAENIIEIDVSDEMRGSFLEYAYSVIYARALPDARDGCKPVQRRILFQMSQMGLRPEKGHVKSQSVVGEVMGKLHPHGDAAIYDALVRLAQPFNLRLPLVDGHGNFGSLDDGPAAARYTEARLAPAAMDLVSNLDEDVVDFVPNYDNRNMQPDVLPAGFPQLLVNGAMGIAVGMATNIAPHNLGEVVAATCHLIDNPEATTADLMRFVPGPDLPEGGIIVGLDGIREAYETGRGAFKTRAKITVERVTARKQGLVITELPYLVGPERVIEKIKEAVNSKKLQGISNVSNLTDRHHGVRLVVEVKNGFNPQAVMSQLFKHTPLEDNFSINAVALVDGRPMTLGLKQMLEVYVKHRLSVIERRSQFRLQKALDRLHLVEGLLVAIVDIDDVIAIIRSSDDVDSARTRLMDVFELSEIQADHILSLRLRRLTKFSRIELETEQAELLSQIEGLRHILGSEQALRTVVRDELVEVSKRLATPRRTVLLSADPQQVETAGKAAAVPLEIPDAPVQVVLTANGGLIRVDGAEPLEKTESRGIWDTYRVAISATARSQVGLIDASGMLHRVEVVDLPEVPRSASNPSFAGAISASQLLGTEVCPVGLIHVDGDDISGFVTKLGQIKRMRPDFAKADSFETILLTDGDEVLFAAPCPDEAEIVMVTSDAQLLRTPAAKIRPQGRVAGGVVGMVIGEGARLLEANFVPSEGAQIVTVAAAADGLFGEMQSSVKVSDLEIYPVKGRATQGVRCHRFLKSESELVMARVTVGQAIASSPTGEPMDLPEADPRRDGSGHSLNHEVAAIV
ncbi:DNA gyrase/topoisomerase IV, A subunit [Gleimia coleocanis DSM 15436]|uniref:DNA topoisomerase (ATP-hydrolyzing) n=1 Tax=Gleimia coleocanis DSM 15436 TaxID=525245 RepID=C0W1T2_9ACTO|nr:DNA topoisomerase IV subunit A [Gleimia coleocanis]EEH63448.1 DNA gyrase/topoisomerase IV, A subunit [Gleimia coleocanis DSM 15436]